jgi:PI-3-kinase-related kinase SMG-1
MQYTVYSAHRLSHPSVISLMLLELCFATVEVEQRDIGAESKVSLEELCRKALDLCIKTNQFSGGTLAQASGLTSTLEATWRRREVARHLQQQVEIQRSTLQRLQLQLTAHHWLHEDTLMIQGAALTAMTPISEYYNSACFRDGSLIY